jgi:anti-sigma factor RsiW
MSRPCEKLQIFADGELPVAERAAFHHHLATCSVCQDALESALMLDALAASISDATAGAHRGERPAPAGPPGLPPPPR